VNADASIDLRKALEKHDFRFLTVAGFTVEYPGVPLTEDNVRLLERYGKREIVGTTDYPMVPDLQKAAMKYAERYNKLLLEHVKGQR
jgi:hypothetical protein